jgi:predicted RNA-binding protein YlxR (DUF448 family)
MVRALKDTERTCIVSREAMPADRLLRFVTGPDGRLTPDLKRRLPGRGAHVALSRGALETAIRRRAFDRALQGKPDYGPELVGQVGGLLRQRALEAVSLANKAGLIIAGFGKVEAALAGGEVLALVEAEEGAPDSRRKLAQAHLRSGANAASLRIFTPFTAADLEVALGRTHVIHAALLKGRAAEDFLRRIEQFVAFETGSWPAGPDDRDEPATPGSTTERQTTE